MKPEQVKVAVTLDNGGVVIMTVVVNDGQNVAIAPTEEYIDGIVTQSSAHGWDGTPVSWRLVYDWELPLDRSFRAAWEDTTGGVGVNMPKARVIHLDRIREAREPLLAELDAQYVRALEADDKRAIADVASKKQALRDLPQTLDLESAKTPDELKAIWPEALKW